MSDPGIEQVQDIFEMMQIDDEWSVREPRGFTWWGHRLAQRVWADEAVDDDGEPAWVVRAQADLLSGVADDGSIEGKVAALNAFATMSALVWHPAEGKITMNCAATMHREDASWLKRSLTMAVALQAAQAHALAGNYAALFKASAAESHHPRSGERDEPDDMLNVVLTAPGAHATSPFQKRDFQTAAKMLKEIGFQANAGKDALTVEFPFTGSEPAAARALRGARGTETALVQAYGSVKNPTLGSGLFLTMQLPISLDAAAAARAAAGLNRREALSEFTRTHLFGAWCLSPREDLTYVSFTPAAVYEPSLLVNTLLSVGLRARWAGTLGL